MNTLNLAGQPVQSHTLPCQPASIYIDGARRRDLELLSWHRRPAPDFDRATLALSPNGPAAQAARFGDSNRLPPIGARVAIVYPPHSDGERFVGVVASHGMTVSEQAELLTAECEHELAGQLGGEITSFWQFSGGGAVELPAARVRFNTGTNELAGSEPITLAGRTCRVFDAGVTARPWTVADALAYLLAIGVPAEAVTPSLAELESLAGHVDLGALEVTGRPMAAVLADVAARGGLLVRGADGAGGLVVFRPGESGRRRTVRLQPPGSQLSTAATNLWQGQVRIRRRPARPSVLALGSRKRYESTFTMRPGWDASLESSRWRDFVRSHSGHWPRLADVYRKWVLNEHGWYAGGPWNLPVHSFAGIAAADFTLAGARRLLPCLSTDDEGRSLGVVVEVRCGDGEPWRRWRGPLWVSEDECAIYLGGDTLPGEFFQAAAAGDASVRVTASVEADARLMAEVGGDANAPRLVVDLFNRAGWRQVDAGSVFHGSSDVGAPAELDEGDVLAALARQHAESAAGATQAELTLGWVDTSFRVGDIIERIDGRRLELSSNPDSRPVVTAVLHEFGSTQTTHLIVSG